MTVTKSKLVHIPNIGTLNRTTNTMEWDAENAFDEHTFFNTREDYSDSLSDFWFNNKDFSAKSVANKKWSFNWSNYIDSNSVKQMAGKKMRDLSSTSQWVAIIRLVQYNQVIPAAQPG